ncbi:MAG TPA: protein kinase [Thermoanaerobaculia bacterium]|nr:protein kinase [Thermoanaerobaculia bacterium]
MTLAGGTRLGSYEVLSALGVGGMGEVYRAKDTKLGRDVAIKVLPEKFFGDRESIARFEREAQSLAAVSHPHIAALYTFEEISGRHLLVMELAEGQTLTDRLVKGPLPLDQLLRLAIEIALALDAAHRAGIVHRDLKPGNVMLTKSGVKLLDFGLAKAAASPVQPSELTSQPTELPKNLTEKGTILGTFQYMAPEQLEGKEADSRTDIFAFGAVLYEMATGKKAFAGSSQASLISAIMSSDPPLVSTIQPMTPPALDRVVRTCLAKDPEERWQSAHDVAGELKWIAEGSQAGAPAVVVSRRKNRERLAWALGALLAVTTAALALLLLTRRVEVPRTVRTSILPPEKAAFAFTEGPVAVSPDGRSLAFVAGAEGKWMLWVRPLSTPVARVLSGTEGASVPFWAPDSRSLGFFADGKLKRIDVSGGAPQTLSDAVDEGGAWNREGTILFSPRSREELHRIPAAGGNPVPVTRMVAPEFTHGAPSFLPDGNHFLYLATVFMDGEVRIGSLDGRVQKRLFRATSGAVYVPPGYLLFARGRTLLAQGFDPGRLELKGEAFPVVEGIQVFPNSGLAVFSASQNGILAYQSDAGGGLSRLVWFDRAGKELETLGPPANYLHPRLSHDGRRLAVDVIDPRTSRADIWIHDLASRAVTRLTLGPGSNTFPVWSPDDSRIAFASSRVNSGDLYVKEASGAGNDEILYSQPDLKVPCDWSMDGRFLGFSVIPTETRTRWDIWTLSLSDRKPKSILVTPGVDVLPRFSPNGRWIAYQSEESGRFEVFVEAWPGPGGRWQVSPEGGREPVWRADGKELFFVEAGRVMAVPVRAGAAFEFGKPQPLFFARMPDMPFCKYDVSADGQRFLVNTVVSEAQSNPITLVQNWTEELKGR